MAFQPTAQKLALFRCESKTQSVWWVICFGCRVCTLSIKLGNRCGCVCICWWWGGVLGADGGKERRGRIAMSIYLSSGGQRALRRTGKTKLVKAYNYFVMKLDTLIRLRLSAWTNCHKSVIICKFNGWHSNHAARSLWYKTRRTDSDIFF